MKIKVIFNFIEEIHIPSMTAKLCAFARAYHSTYARKSGKRFIRSAMPA